MRSPRGARGASGPFAVHRTERERRLQSAVRWEPPGPRSGRPGPPLTRSRSGNLQRYHAQPARKFARHAGRSDLRPQWRVSNAARGCGVHRTRATARRRRESTRGEGVRRRRTVASFSSGAARRARRARSSSASCSGRTESARSPARRTPSVPMTTSPGQQRMRNTPVPVKMPAHGIQEKAGALSMPWPKPIAVNSTPESTRMKASPQRVGPAGIREATLGGGGRSIGSAAAPVMGVVPGHLDALHWIHGDRAEGSHGTP